MYSVDNRELTGFMFWGTFLFQIYCPLKYSYCSFVILRDKGLDQMLEKFFYKRLDSKYLGFVGYTVSVETTQLIILAQKQP